jgi:hypothetical protein
MLFVEIKKTLLSYSEESFNFTNIEFYVPWIEFFPKQEFFIPFGSNKL